MVNPIVSYIPVNLTVNDSQQYLNFKLTELMKPVPNTLKIEWRLDSTTIFNNIDSLQINQKNLTSGAHTLMVNVIDTTNLIRVDSHSTIHLSNVTWTINKLYTHINLASSANKIAYSIYPNPANKILYISAWMEKKTNVEIEMVSANGKLVKRINGGSFRNGNYLNTINIENLASGTYLIRLKAGTIVDTQVFVKQ